MAYRFPIRNYARIAQAALTRNVPVYAHFGVTHRCNLTCKMCGIWRYGNAKEELSIPETREVARRMRRLGVAQVSIGFRLSPWTPTKITSLGTRMAATAIKA